MFVRSRGYLMMNFTIPSIRVSLTVRLKFKKKKEENLKLTYRYLEVDTVHRKKEIKRNDISFLKTREKIISNKKLIIITL